MKRLAAILMLCGVAAAQAPQVPVTGNLGAGGSFPLVNSPAVIFTSDANHTMVYPEMTGSSGFIKVTSSVSLTATRNLIAPMAKGFQFTVENATTGGQAIQVIGTSGSGITIANGDTSLVASDGSNYVTGVPAGGGVTTFNTRSGAVTLSTGDVNAVGTISNSTTGNASTASAAATASSLAATPTQCSGATPVASGVAANGNANCIPGGAPSFSPKCNTDASPASCAADPAGYVTIGATGNELIVLTSAATSTSTFALTYITVGTVGSTNCAVAPTNIESMLPPHVDNITNGSAFDIHLPVAPTANSVCIAYTVF